MKPSSLTPAPEGYAGWLADLKGRIHTAQGWGAKVIDRLALVLRTAFSAMKGFSRANLMYLRAFAKAWPDTEIVQQAVGQLACCCAGAKTKWWPNTSSSNPCPPSCKQACPALNRLSVS